MYWRHLKSDTDPIARRQSAFSNNLVPADSIVGTQRESISYVQALGPHSGEIHLARQQLCNRKSLSGTIVQPRLGLDP